jgi:hypothetical protein
MGTKTDIRPLLSAIALMLRAVLSVTQPPQINPTAIAATAPKAIPWRKRVRASPCKIAGILMMVSFVAQARSQPRTPLASALGRYLAYEIAPSDGAPAAATTTNSDFGGRRFMDSFKVTNWHRVLKR